MPCTIIIFLERNLFHAKLCMSYISDINERTCRKVIQYLKEVIETRGISNADK